MLQVENLRKAFDTFLLDNVSFTVPSGAIVGFIGQNGAGKTTLLRIINSILVSDAGTVTINGEPASRHANRLIGYMPEERGLYDKMRVEDQIMYFGLLKGGEHPRLRVVMEEYMDLFNLIP